MTSSDGDKTCHLPGGEPIVTPERAAKGDVSVRFNDDGARVTEIVLTSNTLVAWLFEIGELGEAQLYDAFTFQLWQGIWKAARGYERSRTTIPRISPQNSCKELGYSLLLRRLPRHSFQTVDYAVNTIADSYTKSVALNRKETYLAAFEDMGRLLTHIKDVITSVEALNCDDVKLLEEIKLGELMKIIKLQ